MKALHPHENNASESEHSDDHSDEHGSFESVDIDQRVAALSEHLGQAPCRSNRMSVTQGCCSYPRRLKPLGNRAGWREGDDVNRDISRAGLGSEHDDHELSTTDVVAGEDLNIVGSGSHG